MKRNAILVLWTCLISAYALGDDRMGGPVFTTSAPLFFKEVVLNPKMSTLDWDNGVQRQMKKECVEKARRALSEASAHPLIRADKCRRVLVNATLLTARATENDNIDHSISDIRERIEVTCTPRSQGEAYLLDLMARCRKLVSVNRDISQEWVQLGCADVMARIDDVAGTEFQHPASVTCGEVQD
jgi:hypothetical protein